MSKSSSKSKSSTTARRKPADIRVGVIGYGGAFNMGRSHLNEMQQAGMTPVAVTELDPARRKAAEDDFPGIQTYDSVEAMLKKSDVGLVTIITPHNSHAPLGLQCLRAGRHVVCEKPLAITTDECDEMMAVAKKSGLVLSTYHNRHWDGCILRALAEVKKKKSIGDIYRIDARCGVHGLPGDWWRSSRSISGGILYDWGVHLLEYSLQLIDSEVVEVSGCAKNGFWAPSTKWKKDTVEDEAQAVVRFRNGAWVNLNITSLNPAPRRGFLEIFGTKGSYTIEWPGYILRRKEGATNTTEEGPHPESEAYRYYANIAAHLCKGEKLIITPEWSRRMIHILDLAVRSAQSGRALEATYH